MMKKKKQKKSNTDYEIVPRPSKKSKVYKLY